jgi:protein TonB
MKRIIYLAVFTLALAVCSVSVQAQVRNPRDIHIGEGLDDGGPVPEPAPAPDPKKPYRMVEQMPIFKGDLNEYLTKNLKYPAGLDVPGGKARTILQFVVTEKGFVKEIEVRRSSGYPKCDEEALRVLEPMKKKSLWTPGKQSGKSVAVFFSLPVAFDFNK